MKKVQTANLQADTKLKTNFYNLVYGKTKELALRNQGKISCKIKYLWHNKKKLIKIRFKDFFKNKRFKYIKKIIINKCFKHLDKINFRLQKILQEEIHKKYLLKENYQFLKHMIVLEEWLTKRAYLKKYTKWIQKQKRICLIIKQKMKRRLVKEMNIINK